MNGPPLDVQLWLAAFAPVALLFALVLWGRFGALVPAFVALGLSLVLAGTVFRSGIEVLMVGLGKGLWLGLWILLVVWPALLLFRLASVGGLDRLGKIFTSILPRRRENLLLVAWIFPSFVQGVAGFGTPIAVTAPLLLAMGWSPVRAVVYPLVGYHWSVTFGSMGSSFYMASLTAGFVGPGQADLAGRAALLLAMNCLVAGALVLVMDGGFAALREGLRLLILAGVPAAGTLVGVALLVPAIATLSAAAVGLGVVTLMAIISRTRARERTSADGDEVLGDAPLPGTSPGHGAALLAPYLYLLLIALPVFVVPASRDWVRTHLLVAPDFAGTSTGFGRQNPPVADYTPVALVGHPGFYILLACGLGYVTFRLAGLWHGPETVGLVRRWLRALPAASGAILVLACLATVLVESGMVSLLARGTAEVTGDVYPALSPAVGAIGSFMTGSTTSSNALFAPMQAQIAGVMGLEPSVLVAAQTAGGNVGNSLAPVIILLGASTVGASDSAAKILRMAILPAAVLLALLSAVTTIVAFM